MKLVLIIFSFVGICISQNTGNQKQEEHLPMNIQKCVSLGNCQTETSSITLDSNWRWVHNIGGYQNCYNGNSWDSSLCPNPDSCTSNCCIEGVDKNDWTSPYGVQTVTGGIQIQLVTQGQYGKNIGSRTYLLNGDKYYMFKLKNREFTFDVDVSNLPCGVNGALYFVEMDEDGGMSKYPTNKAGAKFGVGYCDAQCPHDIKWIDGKSNSKDWKPSTVDPNSGTGHYGSCCAEMDIWEANKEATAYTAHPCSVQGQYMCEGTQCGDSASGDRYKGVCDKDGCDINTYRNGVPNFFGAGSNFQIDSTKPFTVVTQFITSDGTDLGDLVEIKRFWVQNGKKIETPGANLPGVPHFNSIKDSNCIAQKTLFADTNDFTKKGGLKVMGQALDRGVVLVMSLWDDYEAHMLWLDADYPLDRTPSEPGVHRGPCSRDSGNPTDVESKNPNSSVKYMNVKWGTIGSTA